MILKDVIVSEFIFHIEKTASISNDVFLGGTVLEVSVDL